jgi:hypothetical protein
VARNRYGWEKRAKEIARKQKNDEKMKRRQHKGPEEAPAEELAEAEELVDTTSSIDSAAD